MIPLVITATRVQISCCWYKPVNAVLAVVFSRRLRDVTKDKECGRGLRPRPHFGPPDDLALHVSYRPACAERPLLTSTLISTRRFKERPSPVALSATGFSEPYPKGWTSRRKGKL